MEVFLKRQQPRTSVAAAERGEKDNKKLRKVYHNYKLYVNITWPEKGRGKEEKDPWLLSFYCSCTSSSSSSSSYKL